ncbi:hypothetical protein LCGC14_1395460 [marine sediment metagenome]|uniref:Uncharacterized protein n=1 Tax=marine sediment metagenome TaxID=412755 RepID=A0A0F9ME86_9ZZZZ
MGFERIIKHYGRGSVVQPDEIRLNVNSIVFGKGIDLGNEYVEIYFDRELGRLGFKPSNDVLKGFRVSTKSAISSRLTNLGFLKKVSPGMFKVRQENDMYIIEGVVFN